MMPSPMPRNTHPQEHPDMVHRILHVVHADTSYRCAVLAMQSAQYGIAEIDVSTDEALSKKKFFEKTVCLDWNTCLLNGIPHRNIDSFYDAINDVDKRKSIEALEY